MFFIVTACLMLIVAIACVVIVVDYYRYPGRLAGLAERTDAPVSTQGLPHDAPRRNSPPYWATAVVANVVHNSRPRKRPDVWELVSLYGLQPSLSAVKDQPLHVYGESETFRTAGARPARTEMTYLKLQILGGENASVKPASSLRVKGSLESLIRDPDANTLELETQTRIGEPLRG